MSKPRLLAILKPENYARTLPRQVERRANKAVTFRAVAPDGAWSLDLEVWTDGRFDLARRDEHGRGTTQARGNATRESGEPFACLRRMLTVLERAGIENADTNEARALLDAAGRLER